MSLIDPAPSAAYAKPARWRSPANKIFAHQVAFTAPPHDFDAAPTDFLRLAPPGVGAHGRMLHVPGYTHELTQRRDNFGLLEEFVECMANNGADVCAQVGTNWVHASGTTPDEIRAFCDRMADTYETPLHMAGLAVVEALRSLGAERIALNSVYYWPDWRDGYARFLREAGFNLSYVGNFVDQGLFPSQEDVNARTWIFPDDTAARSLERVRTQAGEVDAIVVNGMPNFRRPDGITERMVTREHALENDIGVPIISSDSALYWAILSTIGVAPVGTFGTLLTALQDT
ncbi:MAG: hypothetical protein AAFQ42_00520 [Pseudomonadota bacterium]